MGRGSDEPLPTDNTQCFAVRRSSEPRATKGVEALLGQTLALTTCFFLAVFCATSLYGAKPKLHLFIWSEYIDPKIVADFEQQAGCEVVIDLYDDTAAMMAKLQGGGASLYDVVVPSDYAVPGLIHLKLIAKLDLARLPNLKNIDPKFRNPPYDPGNRFTLPYQWGTLGIYLRPKEGQPVQRTWGLLFDPAQQPGVIVLIDSDRDLIGAALKYRGHSFNSTSIAHLKEARDLILDTKKRSIGFAGAVGGRNKVLSREATAAIAYSGDAARGIQDDPKTLYVIPREGSQIWVDNLAITAGAPHRELAEQFINFLLDEKVGARLSQFTQFATPNEAAKKLLPESELSNPAIYPPAEVMDKLEYLQDLGNQQRLIDELWTQIKSR